MRTAGPSQPCWMEYWTRKMPPSASAMPPAQTTQRVPKRSSRLGGVAGIQPGCGGGGVGGERSRRWRSTGSAPKRRGDRSAVAPAAAVPRPAGDGSTRPVPVGPAVERWSSRNSGGSGAAAPASCWCGRLRSRLIRRREGFGFEVDERARACGTASVTVRRSFGEAGARRSPSSRAKSRGLVPPR